MSPAEYTPAEYPFAVLLRLTYTLEPGGALRVRFQFENQEPALSTHVSFGLHPGLAVSSLDTCQVILPPGRYQRLLAPGNFLSGESVVIDHPGGPMPFAKADLPGSFILDLAGVPERVFTLLDAAAGRRVELDCPEAPYLTLWSDGHDFVCLEPCWGLPDAAQQTSFEEKPGIQEIPAGGTLERNFRSARESDSDEGRATAAKRLQVTGRDGSPESVPYCLETVRCPWDARPEIHLCLF